MNLLKCIAALVTCCLLISAAGCSAGSGSLLDAQQRREADIARQAKKDPFPAAGTVEAGGVQVGVANPGTVAK